MRKKWKAPAKDDRTPGRFDPLIAAVIDGDREAEAVLYRALEPAMEAAWRNRLSSAYTHAGLEKGDFMSDAYLMMAPACRNFAASAVEGKVFWAYFTGALHRAGHRAASRFFAKGRGLSTKKVPRDLSAAYTRFTSLQQIAQAFGGSESEAIDTLVGGEEPSNATLRVSLERLTPILAEHRARIRYPTAGAVFDHLFILRDAETPSDASRLVGTSGANACNHANRAKEKLRADPRLRAAAADWGII